MSGLSCDECDDGYFGFGLNNGCLPCWCGGVVTECTTAGYFRYQVSKIIMRFMMG